jgi:hypothetical protein
MAHCYDNLHSGRAIGRTATLLKDNITAAFNLQTPLQACAIRVSLRHLSFMLCNVYNPPAVPVAQGDLIHLFSQLSSPFIILGDLM